jgi:glycosyltransferase 2 family protein
MSRRWLGLARLAVALVLLAGLWHGFDGGAILAHLGAAHPGWLVLATLLLSAQIVLSALRWRLTAGALGQGFGRRLAIREYHLGVLANMALPGGVLGDAGRALRARDVAGAGIARAATAVVIERLAGQLALALALLLGLALWPGGAGWALLALAALMVAAVAVVWVGRRGPALFGRLAGALARAWLRGGIWQRQVPLSLAIVAANLGAFAAASAAVGAPLDPRAALLILPLTLAAMLIPLSVAGWGLREGAAAALWPLAGFAAEAGIAASVAFGLCALVAALPGLGVLARRAPA